MDEILRQLGGYLLGAIPTIVLLLVVFVAYRALVHRPLGRVLAERHSRTEGAMERARTDISAAGAKAADYEQRLREARAALFKAQEGRRKKALEARAAAVQEARTRAQQQVQQARAAMEQDKVAAQAGLEVEAARLADDIIRAILRPAAAAQNPLAGGRS
ncbi:MAG TPA: ATP synthase F0 subunit B [Terriglobales bacterium]|nr:ATP synthase F0 subunit B [Terriglobales bacterium]